MAKLFAKEKVVATESAKEPVGEMMENEESLLEVEDAGEDIETVATATELSLERLGVMESIRDSMSRKKLCSDDYIASLENYKPIAAKLGITVLPDMSDFRNKYAAESAHQYAAEGFMEVIKSFWEKIKAFFRSFFKKVTIFFKRVLKANLDLESYDKYCDQLVAKLVANKATCSDTSPLTSKLPKYLANRGDTKVDSDFVLRVGYIKIGNMIKMIDTLKSSREKSILNPTEIRAYERDFVNLVEQCEKGYPDPEKTLTDIEELKARGKKLVTDNFKFLCSTGQMPEEVLVAVTEKFGGKRIGEGGMEVRSLCDMHSDFNSLPRNTNIFLATDNETLYCRGSMQDASFVEDRINPIQDLNNLSSVHKTYKNGIAKIDVKGVSKSVDEVSNVTDHFLHMLSKNMPGLIESVSSKSTSEQAPSDLGGEMVSYLLKHKETAKSVITWSQLDGSVTDNPPAGIDSHDASDQIRTALLHLTTNLDRNYENLQKALSSESEIGNHISTVNSMTREQKNLAWSIFKEAVADGTGSAKLSEDDAVKLKDALTSLSRTLNQMFTQLQLIYKDIGILFYQQITEIRYAMIKYIYDSAQRFTY